MSVFAIRLQTEPIWFIYYFSDQARAGMKGKFQELFTARANEWFSTGGIDPAKLELAFGTKNKSEFLAKIKDTSNPIYDFVK